jgi:hypothetical protein
MTIAEPVTIIEVIRKRPGLNVNELLKELIGNRHCLELLRFFVMHPNGRFSRLAVFHGIDENGSRPEFEKALAILTNAGVVKTSDENGTYYYLLTRDEPTRHLVLNLAEFDWHQWQKLDHYYVADRRISTGKAI